MLGKLRMAAGCCAWAIVSSLAPDVFADVSVTKTSIRSETWVKPSEEIRITLDHMPSASEGRISVFIGETDVTSQFRVKGNELIYDPRRVPLPSGEKEVIVHLVKGPDQWKEVARVPIRVLTKSGLEHADVTPRLDAASVSQADDSFSGDSTPAAQRKETDGTFQGGIDGQAKRGGVEFRSTFNALGVTAPEQALRFGEKGTDAPRLDLSDYLLSLKKDDAEFQMGHIVYGNHRHLLNQMGSRGLAGSYKFRDTVTLSVASMNGSSIVGWDNFAGLSRRDHNITAGTVGVQLLKKERIESLFETTLLVGSLQPIADFNVGEVVDSEKSRGIGFRLLTSALSQRVRTDASFARSTHDNPNTDPELSEGVENLVEVEGTTQNARYGEVAVDLLRERKLWGTRTATFTASAHHERLDPQYKSLGVTTTNDQMLNDVVLDATVAGVAAQFTHSWLEDNLDDLSAILKMKTRTAGLTVAAPVGAVMGERWMGKWYFPTVSYALIRTRNFAANRPDPERSGFVDETFGPNKEPISSALPHLITTIHTGSIDWTHAKWSAGYRLSRSFEDNRQVDMENADVRTTTHGVHASLTPIEKVSVNAGFDRTISEINEMHVNRYTDSATLGFDWEFIKNWNLIGNYSRTDESDSAGLASTRNAITDTELAHRFNVPTGWKKLPARAFLRFSWQSNHASDGNLLFAEMPTDPQTSGEIWLLTGGMSITLFPSD